MRLIRPWSLDDGTLTLDSTNVPDVPPTAYSAGTTYADGDTASVLQADGFTYKVYESVVGSNTGNAVTDTDYWLYLGETYGVYSSGTTYDEDDIVISTTTNHAYQSLSASNVGNSLSDTAKWLDLGPTNRYKAFDNSNTSQTSNGESITYTISVSGRADAIAFLNIVAAEIQIVMSTAEDGELINETINLVTDSGINTWWEYFFEPVSRLGDYVRYELPSNLNPTFEITITDPGLTPRIGSLLIGQSRDLGDLLHGARLGITDYSRKDTDEFGNSTIIQRAFAKRATLKAIIPNTRVDAIIALLAQYRATACVIVGHDIYASTYIYGFYKGFEVELAFEEKSYLSIEWEGLT